MADLAGEQLERKRGDTRADAITITDPATGLARDITGNGYLMTINTSRKPDPSVPIGTELSQHIGQLADPENGRVDFPWTTLQADQEPGKYYYDIQETDSAGKILTIAKNSYRFYQDLTK